MKKNMSDILVDIGGTYIRFGLSSDNVHEPACIIKTPQNRDELLSSLIIEINKLIARNGLEDNKVAISCPGLVSKDGTVERALYVPLSGVQLSKEVEDKVKLKTIVINDAKVQAMGYYNYKNLLYINIGTAVGGAYVENNRILGGSRGYAGEFGHIYIGSNIKCICGRRGCLDTVVSGSSFVSELGTNWWDHMEEVGVKKKITIAGHAMGQALSQLCILFNPEEICIAGKICKYELFTENVIQRFSFDTWYNTPISFLENTWENVYLGLKKIIKECV